jgi:hypothetical protein
MSVDRSNHARVNGAVVGACAGNRHRQTGRARRQGPGVPRSVVGDNPMCAGGGVPKLQRLPARHAGRIRGEGGTPRVRHDRHRRTGRRRCGRGWCRRRSRRRTFVAADAPERAGYDQTTTELFHKPSSIGSIITRRAHGGLSRRSERRRAGCTVCRRRGAPGLARLALDREHRLWALGLALR